MVVARLLCRELVHVLWLQDESHGEASKVRVANRIVAEAAPPRGRRPRAAVARRYFLVWAGAEPAAAQERVGAVHESKEAPEAPRAKGTHVDHFKIVRVIASVVEQWELRPSSRDKGRDQLLVKVDAG